MVKIYIIFLSLISLPWDSCTIRQPGTYLHLTIIWFYSSLLNSVYFFIIFTSNFQIKAAPLTDSFLNFFLPCRCLGILFDIFPDFVISYLLITKNNGNDYNYNNENYENNLNIDENMKELPRGILSKLLISSAVSFY